jgi:capsular polysaccharide biosynthesis protein
VAAQWANSYVALTNELLRTHALDESNRNIAYLNGQLAKTDSVDLRKVMYSLIENETKTLMVANGRMEYAFTVVDPATTPELKVGPHRLLNTLVGIMLGFVLGTVSAFALDRVAAIRETVRKVNAPG